MIVEALATAFQLILRAVQSEPTEAKRIARAKREVLALSSRVASDALLRRMLQGK
jgi:hypothetical protein